MGVFKGIGQVKQGTATSGKLSPTNPEDISQSLLILLVIQLH